jgi:Tfp pilus assembly protein PilP
MLVIPGQPIVTSVNDQSDQQAPLPLPNLSGEPAPLVEAFHDTTATGEAQTPEEIAEQENKTKVYDELEKWHREVMSDYVLNLSLLADPFMPVDSALPPINNPKREADERKKPMIQKLALSQFVLNAIIVASDPSDNSANVDGAGRGFIIKKGTMIGPNDGYVKEITQDKVVIEEPVVDFRGETTYRETILSLLQPETEGLDTFDE